MTINREAIEKHLAEVMASAEPDDRMHPALVRRAVDIFCEKFDERGWPAEMPAFLIILPANTPEATHGTLGYSTASQVGRPGETIEWRVSKDDLAGGRIETWQEEMARWKRDPESLRRRKEEGAAVGRLLQEQGVDLPQIVEDEEPPTLSIYSATRAGALVSLVRELERLGEPDLIADIECTVMTGRSIYRYIASCTLRRCPYRSLAIEGTRPAQRRVA